jgi:hypothetical protein
LCQIQSFATSDHNEDRHRSANQLQWLWVIGAELLEEDGGSGKDRRNGTDLWACIVYIYLRKEDSSYIVEAIREGGQVVVASSRRTAALEFPKC